MAWTMLYALPEAFITFAYLSVAFFVPLFLALARSGQVKRKRDTLQELWNVVYKPRGVERLCVRQRTGSRPDAAKLTIASGSVTSSASSRR